MAKDREVIIEFLPCGAYVKVSAIDAATGCEVSIVGDPLRGEAALEDLAVQKLDYVMKRRACLGRQRDAAAPQGPLRLIVGGARRSAASTTSAFLAGNALDRATRLV